MTAQQPGISGPEGGDYTQRLTFTYMIGVYIAVNAIRDMYLLIEGPDCTYMKTQYVQGNHDWLSTLTSVSGMHRIANTALHPSHMSGSREDGIRAELLKIAANPAVPAVAMTSMPMAFITGADYERLTRAVTEATGKPAIHIPGKSLSGDWLDGYAEVLHSLAAQLALPKRPLDARKVAIVGYLFDRNEGDHEGNIRELRRIMSALDLETASIWLAGDSFASLTDVADAGTIISLPYGRRAAKKLARRTGARLVELELPFGLGPTETFVRALGRALDRSEKAEAFIDAELSRVIPKLEWVIPFVFQNRNVGFVGEPHVLPGLLDIVEMLGARMSFAIITNRPEHAPFLSSLQGKLDVLAYPRIKTMARFMSSKYMEPELHLLIAHNSGLLGGSCAVLEFGFPSHFRHALYDRPFLGFQGALSFIDLMANALRMQEVEVAKSKMGGPQSSIVRRPG